ncbi:MAG: ankyrin repeat domain-containing protein [Candidatus Dependentiae bacterium]|nr:ankyrin repeat domain-containing protein [Candidatus Dependentiae bacterium]
MAILSTYTGKGRFLTLVLMVCTPMLSAMDNGLNRNVLVKTNDPGTKSDEELIILFDSSEGKGPVKRPRDDPEEAFRRELKNVEIEQDKQTQKDGASSNSCKSNRGEDDTLSVVSLCGELAEMQKKKSAIIDELVKRPEPVKKDVLMEEIACGEKSFKTTWRNRMKKLKANSITLQKKIKKEGNEADDSESETSSEYSESNQNETRTTLQDDWLYSAIKEMNPQNIEALLEWYDEESLQRPIRAGRRPIEHLVERYSLINKEAKKRTSRFLEIMELFLASAKIHDDEKKNLVTNVFRAALQKEDSTTINRMIEKTAKEYSASFLSSAAAAGNMPLLKRLWKAGYKDIEYVDQQGKNALHHLAENAGLETIGLLSKARPDLEKRDNAGKTLLHYAVANKNKDKRQIIEALIIVGAKPNIRDNTGKTPLHYAVASKNEDKQQIIEDLRIAGANPYLWDNDGVAPIDRSPELRKAETWGSWLRNNAPRIWNHALTGFAAALLGSWASKPRVTLLGTLTTTLFTMLGVRLLECEEQENFPNVKQAYARRTFKSRCIAAASGLATWWTADWLLNRPVKGLTAPIQ